MKNFKDFLQTLNEKVRTDPKQEFSRLKFRLNRAEKSLPEISSDEEKLASANPSRLDPSEKRQFRIARNKLFKRESMLGNISNIRSRMREIKDKMVD